MKHAPSDQLLVDYNSKLAATFKKEKFLSLRVKKREFSLMQYLQRELNYLYSTGMISLVQTKNESILDCPPTGLPFIDMLLRYRSIDKGRMPLNCYDFSHDEKLISRRKMVKDRTTTDPDRLHLYEFLHTKCGYPGMTVVGVNDEAEEWKTLKPAYAWPHGVKDFTLLLGDRFPADGTDYHNHMIGWREGVAPCVLPGVKEAYAAVVAKLITENICGGGGVNSSLFIEMKEQSLRAGRLYVKKEEGEFLVSFKDWRGRTHEDVPLMPKGALPLFGPGFGGLSPLDAENTKSKPPFLLAQKVGLRKLKSRVPAYLLPDGVEDNVFWMRAYDRMGVFMSRVAAFVHKGFSPSSRPRLASPLVLVFTEYNPNFRPSMMVVDYSGSDAPSLECKGGHNTVTGLSKYKGVLVVNWVRKRDAIPRYYYTGPTNCGEDDDIVTIMRRTWLTGAIGAPISWPDSLVRKLHGRA